MQAIRIFAEMSDQVLVAWWNQYGRKAASYRNVPRRAASAELTRRGIPHQWVAPHYPRPNGYETGYMKFWGLGGSA